MKVALCFSGQPRGLIKSFDNIKKSLIGVNECDIFAHIWIDENLRNKPFRADVPNDILENDLESTIQKKMNPTCITYCKQIIFKKKFPDSLNFSCFNAIKNNNPSQNIQSMFYSIYKSNELKKEYEKINRFKYDCVIRCRTDYFFKNTYDLSTFNLKKLNVKSDCKHTEYAINDHLAISNSEIMDVYSEVFFKLQEYCSEGIEFNPEILLGYHIKQKNIELDKTLGDNEESFIVTKTERSEN